VPQPQTSAFTSSAATVSAHTVIVASNAPRAKPVPARAHPATIAKKARTRLATPIRLASIFRTPFTEKCVGNR
jgi:hypothetical protein